jgi:hypothetical protein
MFKSSIQAVSDCAVEDRFPSEDSGQAVAGARDDRAYVLSHKVVPGAMDELATTCLDAIALDKPSWGLDKRNVLWYDLCIL